MKVTPRSGKKYIRHHKITWLVALSALVIAGSLSSEGRSLGSSLSSIDEVEQVEESNNLSQLLRSNAGHYWDYVRQKAPASELAPYLKFEGIVAGDPHMGNFSVIPVTAQGKPLMKYLNIDFDDAGRAPFVLDFARLVIVSKASAPRLKTKHLVEAYIKGLQGNSWPVPLFISEALRVGIKAHRNAVDAYVSRNVLNNRFLYREGKIEKSRGEVPVSELEPLFPKGQILDLAIRVRQRGGSKDALRLWVLVDEGGRLRIHELKAHSPPGVAHYEKQAPLSQWLKQVQSSFWPGIDTDTYELVEVSKGQLFWKREKKVEIVKPPQENTSEFEEASFYLAWHLGRLHGSQASASEYIAQVRSNPEKLKNSIKPLVKTYLSLMRDTLKE